VSEQNVEIVRRIYEVWNSNDLGLELFDPSFELHQGASLLDSAGSDLSGALRNGRIPGAGSP
jgi:hypothetical protein